MKKTALSEACAIAGNTADATKIPLRDSCICMALFS